MSYDVSLRNGLAAAQTTYDTRFNELYANQMPGAYELWTDRIPITTRTLDLRFLANHPVMRQWLGARVEKFLRVYQTSLTIVPYEATLPIKRMDLQYQGNMPMVGRGIEGFLQNGLTAQDLSVATAMDASSGAGPTGFDAVALFSASHPHGPSGNQSNLAAATNLTWSTFDAARQAGTELKFENGEPARVRYTHMRVGPKLERRAKEILQAKDRIAYTNVFAAETATGVQNATLYPNVWAGELQLVVDPRITTYYWDLLDLSKPGVRPMLLCEGRKPEPIHQDKMDSPRRFTSDEFIFGLEGDWVAGAGHWMVAYRGTGTA